MGRLATVAVIMLAATLGGPARAEVLIGLAGPMTGKDAWFGEQIERGAALAVADLNAKGGVLGEPVQLITVDDFCDPEQAVAAARKLVSDGVIFVVGHYCSGASIPASAIYEAAGVLMISPASTNLMLTELGRSNVFRAIHRDNAAGVVAGNYLADHWADKKIAILHDNTTCGRGIAQHKGAVELPWPDGSDLPSLRSWEGITMGLRSLSSKWPISPCCILADTTPRSRSWHGRHATTTTWFSW